MGTDFKIFVALLPALISACHFDGSITTRDKKQALIKDGQVQKQPSDSAHTDSNPGVKVTDTPPSYQKTPFSPEPLIDSRAHPRLILSDHIVKRNLDVIKQGDWSLKAMVARNKERALWLLDHPEYSVASTETPRFNGRRCMRIITETILAERFSTAASLELAEATTKSLRERAKAEYLMAIRRIPFDWYTPYNAQDPNNGALENAEMSVCLAIGYDWLFSTLTAAERRQGREAIGLVLKRYLDQYEALFSPSATVTSESNWNAVINNAAVLAALAIEGEEIPSVMSASGLASVIPKANLVLPRYYDLFSDNGAYPEGPTYLNYSLEMVAITTGSLLAQGRESLGISKVPGIKASGTFMMDMLSPISPILQPESANDRSITYNFSDTAGYIRPSLSVLSWLGRWQDQTSMAVAAQKLASVSLTEFTSKEYQGGTMDGLSILWYVPSNEEFQHRAENRIYGDGFGENNVAVLHNQSTHGNNLYAILKGGQPNKTPHGQLDSGSFILEALGRRWSADMGPEFYSAPGYFNLEPSAGEVGRWHFLRANNLGHSTLNLGRLPQQPEASTRIKFPAQESQTEVSAIADLGQAYRLQAKSVRRKLSIDDRGFYRVRDVIDDIADNRTIEWRMIYCNQVKHGLSKINSNPGCLISSDKAPVQVTGPRSARISEEIVDQPSCKATYLDIEFTSNAAVRLNVFPLDSALSENKIANLSPQPEAQADNSGCFVLSVKAEPSGLTNHFELDAIMTPKKVSP